jgi:hypothetical protein
MTGKNEEGVGEMEKVVIIMWIEERLVYIVHKGDEMSFSDQEIVAPTVSVCTGEVQRFFNDG